MAGGPENLKHKKSSDPADISRSKLLKELREDAGLDTQALADILGIPRKRVSNIENCHETAMKNFDPDLHAAWWQACRQRAKRTNKEAFVKMIEDRYARILAKFNF